MAFKRDKETGEPVEVPTRKVDPEEQSRATGTGGEATTDFRRQRGARPASSPTVPRGASAGGAPSADRGATPFDAPTRVIGAEQVPDSGENQTRLVRPGSEKPEPTPVKPPAEDAMADPVAGWLVVVAGPGKGQVCSVGYGSNGLGRAENARVRLDFGDDQISRENHATLTYDPRGRKFYLQHGGGTNLTYIGDDPVLVPTVLEPMQDFSIGDTTLRFVPFCGPDFDWQDTETA